MSQDAEAISDLVQNWVLWRDASDWERFATVSHDARVMMASWFDGRRRESIQVKPRGAPSAGVRILPPFVARR